MHKSKELVERIKKYESKPILLENFFSSEDLDEFIFWFQESLKHKNFNTTRMEDASTQDNDTTSIPEGDIKNKVIAKLSEKVSPWINKDGQRNLEFEIAFHANKKAYGIHTDSGYDPEEIIYKQGIIPLVIKPEAATTHTVLLDQKCYHSSSFPCVSEDEQAQQYIEHLNFSNVIADEEFKKYWHDSELRRKQMFGFSICHPFEWKLGNTIIWDRAHIHCSSDFQATGAQYKLGLMWISRIL